MFSRSISLDNVIVSVAGKRRDLKTESFTQWPIVLERGRSDDVGYARLRRLPLEDPDAFAEEN